MKRLKRTKSKIQKRRKRNPNHDYFIFRNSGYGPQDDLVFVSGSEKSLRDLDTQGLLFTDDHLDSILSFLIERHIAGEGGPLMKKILDKFDFKKAIIAYNNTDYDSPYYDLGYELSQYERTINTKEANSLLYKISKI